VVKLSVREQIWDSFTVPDFVKSPIAPGANLL